MDLTYLIIIVSLSILSIIYLTSKLKLNAFVSLFAVSLFLALFTLPIDTIIKTLKDGFGNTMASIGFLIIFGAIIAIVLEKTGGALSIANYLLNKVGQKNAPTALGFTGFFAGLPIFCDSGFIILSGLAKSFSAKTKIALPFIATVLACSLYSVHCLVPTHPGALAAAETMKINIGYFIILGIIYAIPGTLIAFFWSKFLTANKNYPPPKMQKNEIITLNNLPSVKLSILPIILPLSLISFSAILSVFNYTNQNIVIIIFQFIGQPVIALLIGVLISFLLIKKRDIKVINSIFDKAIKKAGPIIIVTAAGGMFGTVIKETGIGTAIGTLLADTSLGIFIPFVIAVFMKTAQGSSTVAIITTAAFTEPMLVNLGLDSELGRLFSTLAMGAGSMLVSHANDSYFWVVSRFSGLDINTTLKVYSTSTVVMGITIFICIWISTIFIL